MLRVIGWVWWVQGCRVRVPLKWPFLLGDPGPHLVHGSLGPPWRKSAPTRRHLDWFFRFSRLTNRLHYNVCSNSPYLARRCGTWLNIAVAFSREVWTPTQASVNTAMKTSMSTELNSFLWFVDGLLLLSINSCLLLCRRILRRTLSKRSLYYADRVCGMRIKLSWRIV